MNFFSFREKKQMGGEHTGEGWTLVPEMAKYQIFL